MSGPGELGWEKPPGDLEPLLLKVCGDSWGDAPCEPKLVVVVAQYTWSGA